MKFSFIYLFVDNKGKLWGISDIFFHFVWKLRSPLKTFATSFLQYKCIS